MARLRRYEELDGKTFLICIGAMKAATSSLHAQLAAHPEAAVSPLKEARFFDARFPANALIDADLLAMRRLAFHLAQPGDPVENLRRRPAFRASVDRVRMIHDDDAYFAHFAGLCRPDTRVVTDITPAYAAIGARGFGFMRRCCQSQAKRTPVLFILRDPVDRLWSQARFMPQIDPAADPMRDWPELLRDAAAMARADYWGATEALESVFPRGDVIYLFYETLIASGFAELRGALGLDAPAGEDGDRVNDVTKLKIEIPQDAAQSFRIALADQYAFSRRQFGAAIPAGWSG